MEDNRNPTKKEFGDFGEELAAQHYISEGYAILKRNWRLKRLEIDIIALKGDVVVFVEVKSRSGKDTDAVEAVTLDKMKRMARGADIFLQSMQGELEYRFDIAAVTGNMKECTLEIIEDAFISPLR